MTTLERAIQKYGEDMQLTVAVEEFSELIQEICKSKRGKDNVDNIIEEMADCYIMLEQIKIIFGIKNSEIYSVMEANLERLKNRLDEVSENGT
jgi:NTP pyrophosphatase (non-canonical NTP hydrolase)